MALYAKYKGNPHFERDTNQTLTIKRKAFANNNASVVNGVVELSRYISNVSVYVTTNRLILEEASLGSVNKNATINLLEENGWDHRCSKQKDFHSANIFTQDKGIPSTKTISLVQSLGSSSVTSPKTIAQLMSQRASLTNASNSLPTRDYIGHVTFSDAAKTTNSTTGKKTMGNNAFTNCLRLKSVRMSSDNSWNGFYSTGCFKSCSALTTINTMTNSNSSMSFNVPVTPPAGTISVASGSNSVLGSSTLFTTFFVGQMLYTGSNTRENAKYIGTIQSVQSNTELTLTLPSALKDSYNGTFRLTTEAMIAANITSIGEEALRGTNVYNVSFESHLTPSVAGSGSKFLYLGSNSFMDCPKLATFHFSVKQSSAMARIGNITDSVIPFETKLSVITNDGWSSGTTQTQLSILFNVAITRFITIPNFTYITNVTFNAQNVPTYTATITGIAYQDSPVSLSNLVIPMYITHNDGLNYQVTEINYPFIDQVETIVGQPNRVYGALSSSNPAFNVGGQVSGLSGTLSLPKTLRSIGSNSFSGQALMSGSLTVAGINLTSIGTRCFYNAYGNGRSLLIMGKNAPTVGVDAYRGTSFNPITIRKMTAVELIQYAY
jgi:hypothetical protein